MQLVKEIKDLDPDTDLSKSQRFVQEQQRNLDEFQNILSLIEEASSLVDPFSSTSSEELSSLYESDFL